MSKATINANHYLTYLKKRLRRACGTEQAFKREFDNHLTGVAVAWLKKNYVHSGINYRSLFADRRVMDCDPALSVDADDINLSAKVLAEIFLQATGLTVADPRTEVYTNPNNLGAKATLLVAPRAEFNAYDAAGQQLNTASGFAYLKRKATPFYANRQPKALYGHQQVNGLPVCPYTRYYCQPAFTQPTCSAIAIDRQHIILAGTGLPDGLDVNQVYLLYDYAVQQPGQPQVQFSAQQCLTLQQKVAILPIGQGQAVTLYRTNQTIPADRVVALPDHIYEQGQPINMPAHPAGLPIKISHGHLGGHNAAMGTYQGSLVAEHGCAGAPVFGGAIDQQQLVGICAPHQHNITYRTRTTQANGQLQHMAVPVFNPSGPSCTIISGAAIAKALKAYRNQQQKQRQITSNNNNYSEGKPLANFNTHINYKDHAYQRITNRPDYRSQYCLFTAR